MEILGWFIIAILSVAGTVTSLVVIIGNAAFDGKVDWECILPVVITSFLWWATIANFPFEVAMK